MSKEPVTHAQPGEPAPPPNTPAQHWLAERNACASQEWQDGFNAARDSAPEAPSPQAQGGEAADPFPALRQLVQEWTGTHDHCANELEAYLDAMTGDDLRASIHARQLENLALVRATPQRAPGVDERAVRDALAQVNDAANDARHAGDFAKANALVKARITLYQAALAAPVSAGDGDWYTVDGVHHVDWDAKPSRQLSLMLKPDGKVGFAAYANGERFHGDAMSDDFWRALAALTSGASWVDRG